MTRASSGEAAGATEVAELSALQDSFTSIASRWSAAGIQEVIIERTGADIDPASMTVLYALSRSGGSARPSYVAQQTGTGASNVSKILSRMEAQGLVVRATDPADQRAVSITMTAAGHHVHQAIMDTSNVMLGEVLRDWSSADVKQFSVLLSRYAKALQEAVFR